MLVAIIIFCVIAVILLGLSFMALKKRKYAAGIILLAFAIFSAIISIEGCVEGKNTEWEKEGYVYLQELAQDVYVIQGDDEYVYRVKNPDKSIAEVETILLEDKTEVKIKYLEDPEEVPYIEEFTRYENYKRITLYVFYVPAK